MTAPVALFLGAGASKPFGKMLMGEFVDYLNHQKGYGGNTLFTEIVNTSEGKDLEHLFQELEEWSSKGYSRQGDVQVGTRGGSGLSLEPLMKSVAKKASELRAGVRHEVFNAYRNIEPKYSQELVRRFEGLFTVLAEALDIEKNPLVVFTTNYDPAIENFCRLNAGDFRLCDGFVPQWNAGSPLVAARRYPSVAVGSNKTKGHCIV